MNAFFLSLLAFYLLTLVGYLLVPRKVIELNKPFALYISPALGLSSFVLLGFTLSRLGLEMKYYTYPFVALVGTLISYRYLKKNLECPEKKLIGKLIIAPFGILVSAWPILKYGFNWISYVNDDMNNYVLAAKNFYNSSFFTEPNSSLFNGSDYSQIYYYFYVQGGVRPGSELFLSGYSILNGGDTLSTFMPAILTLMFVLLFSVIALVQVSPPLSKSVIRVTYVLFIFSPLLALGYLYQLIGQVGGLAIGLAVLAIATFVFNSLQLTTDKFVILTISTLSSAFVIWYPELVPFIVAPIIIFLLLNRRKNFRGILITLTSVVAFQIIFLNSYMISALKFITSQFTGQEARSVGEESVNPLFPYFLKPHGFPSLFGFTPINKSFDEPWESVLITFSILLIFLVLIFSILKLKSTPLISLSLAILSFAYTYFVIRQNGFASFKLAMFIQPILIIAMAQMFCMIRWNRIVGKRNIIFYGVLFTFLISQFSTLQFYSVASTGDSSKGFAEINQASGNKIFSVLRNTLSTYKKEDGVVLSTSLNFSQAKLEAIASQGIPIVFPTSDIFANLSVNGFKSKGVIDRKDVTFSTQKYKNMFSQLKFSGKGSGQTETYLISNHVSNILNSHNLNKNSKAWSYSFNRKPSNLLIFVNSEMGPSYYSWTSTRDKAVIFNSELNPMVHGSFMQGIGNHLLFEIVNPSKDPFLVLEISATLLPQYLRDLPDVIVSGKSFQLEKPPGRGSARLLIPIEDLVKINNRLYFQLDLDRKLKPMPESSSGITQIFGSKVRSDSRMLSVFTSNISVIDSSEVSQMQRPSKLQSFPLDLQDSTLEYSGIYEDGWISRSSSFKLSSKKASVFHFKGSIPDLGDGKKFSTNLKIFIGKNLLCDKVLGYGEFDLELPVKNLKGNRDFENVRIIFSRNQILPKPDGRPAVAYVSSLGFN